MARAYTVGTVALALNVPGKWIDNVLSHHPVAGVTQRRQGVARKVSPEGMLQLSLAIILIEDLEIPTAPALRLAESMSDADGNLQTASGLRINIDLPAIRAALESRLAQAVEIAPVPRRGRPPQSASRAVKQKTGRLR
jgi:hypothetical protein